MISKAKPEHLEDIVTLLSACNLPHEDISPEKQQLWVRREAGTLAGVCGIEPYGSFGILRSVAVQPAFRNQGIAASLYQEALTFCKDTGIHTLFLLTTTARDYFGRLGWTEISRAAVPQAVQQSEEFNSLCPDSATCMMLVPENKRIIEALKNYTSGFNCAQSILSAFSGGSELNEETARRLTSGLAAGIGFRGETCGAVLGAYLAIGSKYGRHDVEDDLAKETTYHKMRQFDKAFREQHGALNCRDLLKGNIADEKELETIISKGLFENACPVFVATAAGILNDLL